jgi:GMP synthase (glutamine-hydrolysing)
VNVLALIHGPSERSGVFGEVVGERGHVLEEWSLAWETPPPRPIDDYGAVLVFGGAMHADQDDMHPWLTEETLLIQRLLAQHTPMLGVCLGAQMIARAAHASVYASPEPEIGWHEVTLTDAAADDPVLGRLPERFHAYQWHYYTYDVPAGGVELATSAICTQAYRLGDAVWAVQFHPEVTREQVEGWMEEAPEELPLPAERMTRELAERIDLWNTLGRSLCGAFCDAVERVGTPA